MVDLLHIAMDDWRDDSELLSLVHREGLKLVYLIDDSQAFRRTNKIQAVVDEEADYKA